MERRGTVVRHGSIFDARGEFEISLIVDCFVSSPACSELTGFISFSQLGPDALNLSGCRTGAERVAHRLGQLGIFKTVPRGNSRESRGDSLARDEGAGEGRKTWTRMEEKRHRSGGEGNFFRGLSVGVEA